MKISFWEEYFEDIEKRIPRKEIEDYEILFSLDTNETNKVKTHLVSKHVESTIHKKESGVYFKQCNDDAYLIF